MENKMELIRAIVEARYNASMCLYDGFRESNPEAADRELGEAVTLDGVLALFRDDDHLRKVADIYEIPIPA